MIIGIPLIQSFNLIFPLRLNSKPDFSVCRILSGIKVFTKTEIIG